MAYILQGNTMFRKAPSVFSLNKCRQSVNGNVTRLDTEDYQTLRCYPNNLLLMCCPRSLTIPF